MRSAAAIIAFLLTAVPAQAAERASPAPELRQLGTHPFALIQVDPKRSRALAPLLRCAGGRLISRSLAIWRLPSAAARDLAARPVLRRALVTAEPDVPVRSLGAPARGDPLVSREWWLRAVGANRARPPGPRVPLVIVDTGVDLRQPEFALRPNTTALNPQYVNGTQDVHGTAVASIAAAPANGIGLVGVYPRARLRLYDYNTFGLSSVIAGLDRAARGRRAVINFSGGFYGASALLTRVVDRVVARGSLLVSAVGNDGTNGSRRLLPGGLPHVLTVGATQPGGSVAAFSSRALGLDLVAPGVGIPVAVPTFYNASGFSTFDGTSFAAPMVAAAAAWIWSRRPGLDSTQVAELIRRSARNVGPRGWDTASGFGQLNIPRALRRAAPRRDPLEPNEDVYVVRPGSLFRGGIPALALPRTVRARLDRAEDPADVYRVLARRGMRLHVRLAGNRNVQLAVWGPATRSVHESGRARRRDQLALSRRPGSAVDRASVRVARSGVVYVHVFLGRGVRRAAYSLSVVTSAR